MQRLQAILASLVIAAASFAHAAEAVSVDDALKALPKYEFGQSRAPLVAIEQQVNKTAADATARAQIEQALAAIAAGDATLDAKRFACRQLRQIATDGSVPAMSKLLADEDLSHPARAVLEGIPTDGAAAVLRNALGTLKGNLLVGVIGSVGNRRDAQAVSALARLLSDGDEQVRIAAANALGKIGNDAAVAALAAAQATGNLAQAVADAQLIAAEQAPPDKAAAIYEKLYRATLPVNIRAAALLGLATAQGEKALPIVLEVLQQKEPQWQVAAAEALQRLISPKTAAALIETLPKLSPAAQAGVLEAMAAKLDVAAIPAGAISKVLPLAASEDESVKIAVARVLGALGDQSCAVSLAMLAAEGRGKLQETARAGLAQLKVADVSAAMIQPAASATLKPAARVELVNALGVRHESTAAPALLKLAADKEEEVRIASLRAMALIAGGNDAPALLALMLQAPSGEERESAEQAVVASCRRIGDGKDVDASAAPVLAVFATARAENKESLMNVLVRLGGAKAMAAVRSAAADADEQVQTAAVRAMANLADESVAADLQKLAADASAKPAHRILALRGWVRYVGASKLNAAQKVAAYKQALDIAHRPEEKRLALSGFASVVSADSLKAAMACLDDPAIRNEAAQAAVNVAKTLKDPALVKQAMQKVIDTTSNARIKQQAQDILSKTK